MRDAEIGRDAVLATLASGYLWDVRFVLREVDGDTRQDGSSAQERHRSGEGALRAARARS